MKKLFAILISAFQLFSFSAFATSVYFPVLQMTGSTNDVTINVRAVNNPVIWNGAFHYLPANGTNFTTSGGYATNSFVPGRYTMAVVGLAQSWTIFVTNSASLLNAVDLTVGTGIVKYSGIQSLSATGLQLTNDGYGNFFLVNTNPGSAGEATNVFFLDSPTITWSTTSSSNVAKLSSNVTNDWRNYTLTASNSITTAMTNQNTGTSNGLFAHIVAATNGLGGSGVDSATVVAIMATNNAATATLATNLSAPFGFSQVLVSSPTNDTVESHADFTYDQSANFSTLSLGATWDLGNTSVRGGLLQLRDAAGDVNVSIGTTNGRIFFNDAIEVRDGVTHYAKVNGVHIPWFKPEQHSVAEPIYYWGGHQLAAQAWLVGSYEEGLTNGRFSFLVGELGLGWNIGRSTNSGSDVTYMTGDTSQNITNTVAWLNGPTGPELKAVMSYRRDDNRNILGGAVRGTTIVGTNVLTAVGDNRMDVSSNYVSIGSTGKTGSIRLWDDINQLWLTIDATDGSFNFYDYNAAFLAQSVDQYITVRATNVIRGEGSLINAVGLTNGNVTIPGTLNVSGTTTAGTLYSPNISGDGAGITNLQGVIAKLDGYGTNTYLTNAIFTGVTSTNQRLVIVNPSDGTGMIGSRLGSGYLWQSSAGNSLFGFTPNSFLAYTNAIFSTNVEVRGVIHGHGSGVTNLNASNLASGTVPYARAGSFTNHDDVTVTSLTPGDVMAYSGSTWTNGAPASGGGGAFIANNNGSGTNTSQYGRLNITATTTNALRLNSTNTFEGTHWLTMDGSAHNYTNSMIYLSQAGTNNLGQGTAGSMIDIYKQLYPNTTNGVGGEGITIQFNTNCTGYAIEISHKGSGAGILVTKQLGTGIQVDSSSTGKGVLVSKTGTANVGIEISQSTAHAGLYSYVFGVGGYAALFEDLVNNNTAGRNVYIRSRRDGSSGHALEIEKQPASTATAGSALKINTGVNATGVGLDVDHRGTGSALRIYNNTTDIFRVTTNSVEVANTIAATNGYYMPSNSLAIWPTAPRSPGEAYWGNSNGTIYLLQSGMGSTWIATNKIGL